MKVVERKIFQTKMDVTCDCGQKDPWHQWSGAWPDKNKIKLEIDCEACCRCRTYVGSSYKKLKMVTDLPSQRFAADGYTEEYISYLKDGLVK